MNRRVFLILGASEFLIYALLLFSPIGGGRASLAFGGKLVGAMCGERFCMEQTGYQPDFATLFRNTEVAFRYGPLHADKALTPVTPFDMFYITMLSIFWFCSTVLTVALAIYLYKEAWQGRFYRSVIKAFQALNKSEISLPEIHEEPTWEAYAILAGLLLAGNFLPWVCVLFCCR